MWRFFFSSRRRHTRCALVTGVQTCALPIFPPGKVHIGEIQGHKDARSALMAGDGKAITNAFFNAEEFKPDGIFTVADLRAAALQPVEWGIPWWSPTLTKWTFGRGGVRHFPFGRGEEVERQAYATSPISLTFIDWG